MLSHSVSAYSASLNMSAVRRFRGKTQHFLESVRGTRLALEMTVITAEGYFLDEGKKIMLERDPRALASTYTWWGCGWIPVLSGEGSAWRSWEPQSRVGQRGQTE